MTHSEITDAVRQGVAPRDVYPAQRKELPSQGVLAAARDLMLALGRLEDADREFTDARHALREALKREGA